MAKNRRYRSRLAPVFWATALLYTPLAQALGLGPLTVTSNLGQPLQAEIPLLSFHRSDRHAVRATMASSADFAAAGLRKSRALRAIRARVQRAPGGGYELVLQSRRPMNEPFLHFLLRVRWPGGSLLHVYTAFLNPASGISLLTASSAPPRARPIVSSMPPPVRVGRARLRVRRARLRVRRARPATTVVRPGQSLWAVAARTAPQGVAMPQTLEAFLRANPGAFLHKNVNELRAGAVLRIPTRRAIEAVAPHHAAVWLASQDAAWNRYKTRLANVPAIAKGGSPGLAGALGSARVLPANREPLRIEAAKLTGPVTPGGGSAKMAGAGSFGQRVQRLRKELQKTRRLMTLESQELALLQKQAAQRGKPQPVAAGVIPKVGVKKPVRAMAKPPVKPRPQPIRHVVPPVRPLPPLQPAPSFLSMLMSSERTPILGALLVIVLGGGLLVIRRRRQTMAEFEESILSGGGLNSEGQMPDTAGLPKTPDVSFLSGFSQAGSGGAMHTDEVDPLAEADVYLAYGRDEQAEEILREASAKEPGRIELKLKLLEIYLQRNDKKTFEIVAEEIYAASEGQGPAWQKVEEMGRKLDPANPLFRGESSPGLSDEKLAGDEEGGALGGFGDRIDFAAVARELEEVSAPRRQASGLDDMDNILEWPGSSEAAKAGEAAPHRGAGPAASEDEGVLDFSVDLGRPSGLMEHGDERLPKVSAAEDAQAGGLDFQWDHSSPTAAGNTTTGDEFAIRFDEEVQDFTAGDLDLTGADTKGARSANGLNGARAMNGSRGANGKAEGDLPFVLPGDEALEENEVVLEAENGAEGGNDAEGDNDAVDTKLDLARAYIEMGDHDGARGILEEVRAEGSSIQRAQADSLIGSIL